MRRRLVPSGRRGSRRSRSGHWRPAPRTNPASSRPVVHLSAVALLGATQSDLLARWPMPHAGFLRSTAQGCVPEAGAGPGLSPPPGRLCAGCPYWSPSRRDVVGRRHRDARASDGWFQRCETDRTIGTGREQALSALGCRQRVVRSRRANDSPRGERGMGPLLIAGLEMVSVMSSPSASPLVRRSRRKVPC